MKQCAICQKTSNAVWRRLKLRGKYNPTVKRLQRPNLQWVRLPFSYAGLTAGSRIKACTKCIKALAKLN